jgi:hypothetical protein
MGLDKGLRWVAICPWHPWVPPTAIRSLKRTFKCVATVQGVTDETYHNRKFKHPGSVAGQLRYTSEGERGEHYNTNPRFQPGGSRWSATRGAVCRAIRAALVAN